MPVSPGGEAPARRSGRSRRTDAGMRLNRFLASSGLGSRRAVEELIRQGRVEVNGAIAGFPGPDVDPEKDEIRCDGERIRPPRRWLYLAMNKPAGYVTTLSDERGRKTIEDLLGGMKGRVFPIGRLDRSSEGLLLLTNNGELANRLLHPRFQQERTYLVWVRPVPDLEAILKLRAGVMIGPGERTGPARVRVLGRRGDIARVRISLREGRNREIRRMLAVFDLRVLALRRIAYAGIELGGLEPGMVRPLAAEEISLLARHTGLSL